MKKFFMNYTARPNGYNGYKCRMQAIKKAPESMLLMLEQAGTARSLFPLPCMNTNGISDLRFMSRRSRWIISSARIVESNSRERGMLFLTPMQVLGGESRSWISRGIGISS